MRTLMRIFIILGAVGVIVGGAYLASLVSDTAAPVPGGGGNGGHMFPGRAGAEISNMPGGRAQGPGEGNRRHGEEGSSSGFGLAQLGNNFLTILVMFVLVVITQTVFARVFHKKRGNAAA